MPSIDIVIRKIQVQQALDEAFRRAEIVVGRFKRESPTARSYPAWIDLLAD